MLKMKSLRESLLDSNLNQNIDDNLLYFADAIEYLKKTKNADNLHPITILSMTMACDYAAEQSQVEIDNVIRNYIKDVIGNNDIVNVYKSFFEIIVKNDRRSPIMTGFPDYNLNLDDIKKNVDCVPKKIETSMKKTQYLALSNIAKCLWNVKQNDIDKWQWVFDYNFDTQNWIIMTFKDMPRRYKMFIEEYMKVIQKYLKINLKR